MDRVEKTLGIIVVTIMLADRFLPDEARVQQARWHACARVAEWFGRQALSAESAYREAVAP
jgi:hypothetical protein